MNVCGRASVCVGDNKSTACRSPAVTCLQSTLSTCSASLQSTVHGTNAYAVAVGRSRANNDDLSPCLSFFLFSTHFCLHRAYSNMSVQYEGFATLSTCGRAKLHRCNTSFHRAQPQNPFPSSLKSCYAVELLKSILNQLPMVSL